MLCLRCSFDNAPAARFCAGCRVALVATVPTPTIGPVTDTPPSVPAAHAQPLTRAAACAPPVAIPTPPIAEQRARIDAAAPVTSPSPTAPDAQASQIHTEPTSGRRIYPIRASRTGRRLAAASAMLALGGAGVGVGLSFEGGPNRESVAPAATQVAPAAAQVLIDDPIVTPATEAPSPVTLVQAAPPSVPALAVTASELAPGTTVPATDLTVTPATEPPPPPPPTTVPLVDLLGIGVLAAAPPCDGAFVTLIGAAVTPGAYAHQMTDLLSRFPGSSYLLTRGACSSFRQEMTTGEDIFVAFYGPFATAAEACAARASGPADAYVKRLDNVTDSSTAIDC